MTRWLTALLDRLRAHPVLALTTACLVAFAVTIPLPRVDGQLVGSDGVRYFAYLPSLLIDGDLDLSDEYAALYRYDPAAAEAAVGTRTSTGLPANRLGIGPAILWSPFFLVAHLLALLLGRLGFAVAADGYGYLYQACVLAGGIVYGGLGAWACARFAGQVVARGSALTASLLVVLAGNLVYYMTVEPSMSHAPSMFASSMFFLVWLRTRSRPQWRHRLLLGGLAGLMALIRPQDGLLLALPMIDEAMTALGAARRRGLPELAQRLAATLVMPAMAFAAFVPQLLVWKTLHGDYLRSGYADEFGVLFHWASPHLLEVLFSAQRGLFLWHPVLLLALAGLWWVGRRDRRLAALCLLGFVVQWVLVSSWREWEQGDAFGGRMFIVCTPIFVLGGAALADRVTRQWSRRPVWAVGAALVLLNYLLLLQYRMELLWVQRPLTLLDLTLGRFLILF